MKTIFTGTQSSDIVNNVVTFIEDKLPPYNGATHSVIIEIVTNTN